MNNLPIIGTYTAPANILGLLILFSWLRFENQRWIRDIASGRSGANPIVPLLVNLTGFAALVLIVSVYGILFWKAGFVIALGTFAANTLASLLLGIAASLILRGDNLAIWLVSTLALWPVGYLLATATYETYLG